MTSNQKWLVGAVVGLLVVCLCLSAACVALGGLAVFGASRSIGSDGPSQMLTRIATAIDIPEPDATDNPKYQTPMPPIEEPTPSADGGQGAQDTLRTLEKEVVPINDPRDLAQRLEGKTDIPETLPAPAQPFKIGDQQSFWATNDDNNKSFQVKATLRYISDHLYFWVENDINVNAAALTRLGDAFEKKIYPTDRAFFGSEWTPGIDNDVHLYALYVRGLGGSVAAYYSAADEVPSQLHPYSNQHEMFIVNADGTRIEEEYTYGTLAHEFQHMIHWYRDRNEQSWLNEGFSELASLLNGYDPGGADRDYASDPDIQLTYWPRLPDSIPHYGQSFLFMAYFLDRFGEKATQAVVANPENGLDSFDAVLTDLKATDPRTGQAIQADDVFADWAVATYLNNPKVDDGRYVFQRYTNLPRFTPTETITSCTPDWQPRTVHQYGVDYIQIDCSGKVTLQFTGAQEVDALPTTPHSGKFAFWSNKGDSSDMTLTHAFDFTQVSGPLTLEYATWYDLEKDYDYVYLEASTDGKSWQILNTPSGRDKKEDPSGNAYGWAYNDQSAWREEQVDLSAYAGKQVQLRFEYVTDMAVNGDGFLLDDVSIPQIDYHTDFEQDAGGWENQGFVRIENHLPQTFRLSLIEAGKTTHVQAVTLDPNQQGSVTLDLGGANGDAVLVVSGTTRFTTQQASYRFRFQP